MRGQAAPTCGRPRWAVLAARKAPRSQTLDGVAANGGKPLPSAVGPAPLVPGTLAFVFTLLLCADCRAFSITSLLSDSPSEIFFLRLPTKPGGTSLRKQPARESRSYRTCRGRRARGRDGAEPPAAASSLGPLPGRCARRAPGPGSKGRGGGAAGGILTVTVGARAGVVPSSVPGLIQRAVAARARGGRFNDVGIKYLRGIVLESRVASSEGAS